MNKPVQEILEQIRSLPLDEREQLIASAKIELEIERDTASGVDAEIERRAHDAIANPGKGRSVEDVFARAHAAVAAVHASRSGK